MIGGCERKGLLQTLQDPHFTSPTWTSKRPDASRGSDVHRNPRGQYFDPSAVKMLHDPKHFSFQLVPSVHPRLVGQDPNNSEYETIYKLRNIPLPYLIT